MSVIVAADFALKLEIAGWMILLTSSELVLKVLVIFFITVDTCASYWSIFWAKAFFSGTVGMGDALRTVWRATIFEVVALMVAAAAVAFSGSEAVAAVAKMVLTWFRASRATSLVARFEDADVDCAIIGEMRAEEQSAVAMSSVFMVWKFNPRLGISKRICLVEYNGGAHAIV